MQRHALRHVLLAARVNCGGPAFTTPGGIAFSAGGPTNSNVPGKRVFSVDIEGQRRLSNYDIIADVGTMAAAIKRFDVTVNDGSLSLFFSAELRVDRLTGSSNFSPGYQ